MIDKDFKRISKSREIKKIFVIATEGEKTEPQYFKGLKNYLRNPAIYIKVIERNDSASAPQHVIKHLDSYKKELRLKKDYELWSVIDRDGWGNSGLRKVAQLSYQKGFHLAVSNPCFEIWLLLHLRDVSKYKESDIRRFEENCDKVVGELKKICGSYKKCNIDPSVFIPHINKAITRAIRIDKYPKRRWPDYLATRVYKLIKNIIADSK